MRKIMIALVVALCAFGAVSRVNAGSYQGTGNYVGSPSSQVTAIFAAFPGGGEGLTDAIRELLINNPGLADDVAYVASNANPDQQQAAAFGMAQAVLTLLARGNNSGASAIVTAATFSGNATLATVVSSAVATSGGAGSLYAQGTNGNPATTTSCTTVSPTSPGGAC